MGDSIVPHNAYQSAALNRIIAQELSMYIKHGPQATSVKIAKEIPNVEFFARNVPKTNDAVLKCGVILDDVRLGPWTRQGFPSMMIPRAIEKSAALQFDLDASVPEDNEYAQACGYIGWTKPASQYETSFQLWGFHLLRQKDLKYIARFRRDRARERAVRKLRNTSFETNRSPQQRAGRDSRHRLLFKNLGKSARVCFVVALPSAASVCSDADAAASPEESTFSGSQAAVPPAVSGASPCKRQRLSLPQEADGEDHAAAAGRQLESLDAAMASPPAAWLGVDTGFAGGREGDPGQAPAPMEWPGTPPSLLELLDELDTPQTPDNSPTSCLPGPGDRAAASTQQLLGSLLPAKTPDTLTGSSLRAWALGSPPTEEEGGGAAPYDPGTTAPFPPLLDVRSPSLWALSPPPTENGDGTGALTNEPLDTGRGGGTGGGGCTPPHYSPLGGDDAAPWFAGVGGGEGTPTACWWSSASPASPLPGTGNGGW